MKKRTKTMLIAGVIVTIIIVGVLWIFIGFKEGNAPKEGDTRLISVEPIGGTYNASIFHE